MTLSQIQKQLTEKAAQATERLYRKFNPKTRSTTAIVTIQVPILIEEDDEDPDTGYTGRTIFHFDDNEVCREINAKIQHQLEQGEL